MCENMTIWCLCSVSEAFCASFEALCSVFYEHYTESGNCSVFDEDKGGHTLTTCISHLKKREMCS
jgi:hypothetical protein